MPTATDEIRTTVETRFSEISQAADLYEEFPNVAQSTLRRWFSQWKEAQTEAQQEPQAADPDAPDWEVVLSSELQSELDDINSQIESQRGLKEHRSQRLQQLSVALPSADNPAEQAQIIAQLASKIQEGERAIADEETRNRLASQERERILGVEDIGRVFQRENDRLIEELARSRNFGVSNEQVPGGTLNYLLRNQRDFRGLPERSFTQPVQLIPQSSLVQPLANVPQFTPQGGGVTATPAIAPIAPSRVVNFAQDNTVNVTVQGQQTARDIEDTVFSAIVDASTEARRQLEAP